MAEAQNAPAGPDLALGVTPADFKNGMLLGHVGDQDVLLVQSGSSFFAIDAHCSHYHGPLADGLVVGASVRCPWHHACFDLRTGEAVRAPALGPVDCWKVEQRDGRIFVKEKREPAKPQVKLPDAPGKIVIVGGGAAGFAAAEMLRRRGFGGSIAMVSNDAAPPVDRPNLSKDYLAGSAPEDWLPLRLATGAEPVRLPIPGADEPHVHTLRSLNDCRAIIASANGARRAVVIGASFIGLEVAASLRAREIEVHVVAPESRPMERVLGPEMGDFVRDLHEQHGVVFHLGDTVTAIDGKRATLKGGGVLEADLFVVGAGVRPRLALAEKAGLAL